MSRLLYIETSPRKERSSSIKVAQAFLDAYRDTHPGDEVEVLDLWKANLPPFDGDIINAKYRILHREAHTEAERNAWRAVEEIIAHFKSFDKYLFSIPMWNFGIPYILKHYIDILVQPGYTFNASAAGVEGLVTGRQAAAVYTRAGAYPQGSEREMYDLQKRYLEAVLGFIGLINVRSVIVEPTFMLDPEESARMLDQKKQEARKLGAEF